MGLIAMAMSRCPLDSSDTMMMPKTRRIDIRPG
jgi:hypothetical protein